MAMWLSSPHRSASRGRPVGVLSNNVSNAQVPSTWPTTTGAQAPAGPARLDPARSGSFPAPLAAARGGYDAAVRYGPPPAMVATTYPLHAAAASREASLASAMRPGTASALPSATVPPRLQAPGPPCTSSVDRRPGGPAVSDGGPVPEVVSICSGVTTAAQAERPTASMPVARTSSAADPAPVPGQSTGWSSPDSSGTTPSPSTVTKENREDLLETLPIVSQAEALTLAQLMMKTRFELMSLLRMRGLPTHGNKNDLLYRLLLINVTSGEDDRKVGSTRQKAASVTPATSKVATAAPTEDQRTQTKAVSETNNRSVTITTERNNVGGAQAQVIPEKTPGRRPIASFEEMMAYNDSQLDSLGSEQATAESIAFSDGLWEEIDEEALMAEFRSLESFPCPVDHQTGTTTPTQADRSAMVAVPLTYGASEDSFTEIELDGVSQSEDVEQGFSLLPSRKGSSPVQSGPVPDGKTGEQSSDAGNACDMTRQLAKEAVLSSQSESNQKEKHAISRKKSSSKKRKSKKSTKQASFKKRKGSWHHCGSDCESPSDEEGSWMVLCDVCVEWYHYKCEKVTADEMKALPPEDDYVCLKCRTSRKTKTRSSKSTK